MRPQPEPGGTLKAPWPPFYFGPCGRTVLFQARWRSASAGLEHVSVQGRSVCMINLGRNRGCAAAGPLTVTNRHQLRAREAVSQSELMGSV